MKKICTLCLTVVILSTMLTLVHATEPSKNVVDLGDDFYMVETITQYSMGRANNTASGTKTGNVYHGSLLVGTATLGATFDISASNARAIQSVISGTGYNGGIYVNGTSDCSGSTASGTAHFKFDDFNKYVSFSISCSSDGTLS